MVFTSKVLLLSFLCTRRSIGKNSNRRTELFNVLNGTLSSLAGHDAVGGRFEHKVKQRSWWHRHGYRAVRQALLFPSDYTMPWQNGVKRGL
uniref:Putative secreted protein n=1 Tax=Anopheles darlingi TaxID=43151 RepID=A0A2M4DK76_ANODA